MTSGRLSQYEKDFILDAVLAGLSVRYVSERLNRSSRTVQEYYHTYRGRTNSDLDPRGTITHWIESLPMRPVPEWKPPKTVPGVTLAMLMGRRA